MHASRRQFLATAASAAGAVAMPSLLRAQSAGTDISVQYSIPGSVQGSDGEHRARVHGQAPVRQGDPAGAGKRV